MTNANANNTIPLYFGAYTQADGTLDEHFNNPAMILKRSFIQTHGGTGTDDYDILLGGHKIGEVSFDSGAYNLRWLRCGGCWCGGGKADLTTDMGRVKLAAHIFHVLAQDADEFVADNEVV
jgi:hypothetical protein